ncbi:MAG: Holliday junction branch migration protein RuvA [Arachnia sp.]
MIAQLTGEVLRGGATDLVISVSGVGFQAHTTPHTAAALRPGEVATIFTTLVVREDSLTLFGFGDAAERDAFELVQTASGVGPKLALAIVSVLGPGELREALAAEDLARLCSVPGIGRKGAQRLVLELKDKVMLLAADAEQAPSPAPVVSAQWRERVLEGLQGLGWSARDATAACEAVAPMAQENPELPIGQLMRAALSSLARP